MPSSDPYRYQAQTWHTQYTENFKNLKRKKNTTEETPYPDRILLHLTPTLGASARARECVCVWGGRWRGGKAECKQRNKQLFYSPKEAPALHP